MNRILYKAILWIFEKIEALCVYAGSDMYRTKIKANGWGQDVEVSEEEIADHAAQFAREHSVKI